MEDRTPAQNLAEVLKEFAQIQRSLSNLSISATARHLALCDLLPNFESRYLEHMGDAKVLRLKDEYEHRISILLEASRKMSESKNIDL
jgi:hypothetical protein